jgi:hypothetical protein
MQMSFKQTLHCEAPNQPKWWFKQKLNHLVTLEVIWYFRVFVWIHGQGYGFIMVNLDVSQILWDYYKAEILMEHQDLLLFLCGIVIVLFGFSWIDFKMPYMLTITLSSYKIAMSMNLTVILKIPIAFIPFTMERGQRWIALVLPQCKQPTTSS